MTKRDNPNYLKNLAKRLESSEAQVGFFESARYPDGTPVAYVAAIQEYGYPEGGIPPRSFMRSTIDERAKPWSKVVANGAKSVIQGNKEIADIMETIGLLASGDMRKKISKITQPPLKESTIKNRRRKGNNSVKPLVDERIMLPSLTHVVIKK